jgi:hypothetical protein
LERVFFCISIARGTTNLLYVLSESVFCNARNLLYATRRLTAQMVDACPTLCYTPPYNVMHRKTTNASRAYYPLSSPSLLFAEKSWNRKMKKSSLKLERSEQEEERSTLITRCKICSRKRAEQPVPGNSPGPFFPRTLRLHQNFP